MESHTFSQIIFQIFLLAGQILWLTNYPQIQMSSVVSVLNCQPSSDALVPVVDLLK